MKATSVVKVMTANVICFDEDESRSRRRPVVDDGGQAQEQGH